MSRRIAEQVLMLASVDWGAAWQRHHAFAAAFAAQGAEVFFVENTGFRDLRPADFTRVGARLRRLTRRGGEHAPSRPKGVRIVSPLVLPPTRPAFRAVNTVYLLPWLLARLRRRGLRPGATVFAYLPTATTLRLIDLCAPARVVYDCVDNFAGHPAPPEDLAATEAALLERADTVLTTSRYLFEAKSRRHPNTHLIHHGTSEAFLGTPRPQGPIRRLCYFGTVWSAVDFAAVRALAEAGYSVTLAGPVKEPPPPLPGGVDFVPAMPHERLPAFLAGFDALLLPYAKTEYNKGVVPAKLWECLATGKPVLASALPSLKEHADLLYMAERPGDFPALARRAAERDGAEASAARIAAARGRTVAAQARSVADIVRSAPVRHRPHGALPAQSGEVFLRGFSWIAALFAAARLSTFAVQFIGARMLGPAVYGTAHLVGAVAALAQVVPMLGFPLALSHFTASADNDRLRGRLVVTGLTLFGLWAAACAAVAAGFAPSFARLTHLSPEAWGLAAVLALATAFHHVSSSSLQGLGRFRERGSVEALYGAASLASLLALLALGERSYSDLVVCYIAGLAAASAASLALLFRRVRGAFDATVLASLVPYASLGVVHVLAAALIQAPGRIVTFRLHDAAETGLYSAYFATTVQAALALSNMLQTVLIPLASRAEARKETAAAVRGLLPAAVAAGWVVFSLVALAGLGLLGKDYPLRLDWLLLFGAAASMVCAHGAVAALFFARGMDGLWTAAFGTLAAGIGNLLCNLLLTPAFGTTGAAVSLCVGYGLGLGWFISRLHTLEGA
ncbi:MAG: oligosaccharide flippase family protein [Elusimicrobia bacterium]|nr:oligosaccharide flippase family protein [Elusimicrobiota bacterium]